MMRIDNITPAGLVVIAAMLILAWLL